MTVANFYDVCVIGGGPSGSTAAAILSRKGYKVLLLERSIHPRYMVGESLIPHFWRYAADSGALDAIVNEGFIEKAGGTVSWRDEINHMAFKDFGYTRPALHVERDRFDQILFDNARIQGAYALEDANVTAVLFDEGKHRRVQYRLGQSQEQGEVSCRYVIDATGQRSLVSSQLKIRELDDDFRFCSVWGYFENSKYVGPNGEVHDFKNLRNTPPTTFVTSVGDSGWAWHIPLRKSTSVGFVVPTGEFKSLKTGRNSIEATFMQMCETTPILERLLAEASFCPGSTHVIRDYSYRSRKNSLPNCYLIGDAAAFIDPIFSIGVVLGMYSATLAAWAIDRSLRNAESAEHYRSIYDNQLNGRLDLARALALPAYIRDPEEHAQLLLNQLAFQSHSEQALCAVVSKITDRSSNYTALVDTGNQAEVAAKIQRLETINW